LRFVLQLAFTAPTLVRRSCFSDQFLAPNVPSSDLGSGCRPSRLQPLSG